MGRKMRRSISPLERFNLIDSISHHFHVFFLNRRRPSFRGCEVTSSDSRDVPGYQVNAFLNHNKADYEQACKQPQRHASTKLPARLIDHRFRYLSYCCYYFKLLLLPKASIKIRISKLIWEWLPNH